MLKIRFGITNLAAVAALALVPFAAIAEVICPIEVGSVGVKARAIDLSFDTQCNLSTKTLFSEDENTDIFKTIQQGRLMPEAVQATAKAVGRLAGKMQAKYPACPMLVVGSSGVALASNITDLKQAVAAEGFQDMGFVTPEQEAKYAFRSSVPLKQRGATVLFDIGGSNTKIGYIKGGEFQSMTVVYGSTSLAKAATDSGLPFRFGVAKTLMDKVLPKFRDDTKEHPDVLKRTSLSWVGGMAWATATFSHPESADKPTVTISRSDLEEFLIALEKDTWKSRQVPAGMTPATRAAWSKDWADVQKTFTRERLIAGVTLMKVMLSDGLYRESITFPRYGQWVWGYGLEVFKIASATCS
jgi:hypothetical protein